MPPPGYSVPVGLPGYPGPPQPGRPPAHPGPFGPTPPLNVSNAAGQQAYPHQQLPPYQGTATMQSPPPFSVPPPSAASGPSSQGTVPPPRPMSGPPKDPAQIKEAIQRIVTSPLLRGYVNPKRVVDDASYIVANYKTLGFSVAELERQPLFRLNGTLPVTYQGRALEVPIDIWLPLQYPDQAPLCFVYTTSRALELRASHPYVHPNGSVIHEYLTDWTAASSLAELIMLLSSAFDDDQSPIVPVGDPLGITVARAAPRSSPNPPPTPPARPSAAAASSAANRNQIASAVQAESGAAAAAVPPNLPPLPSSGPSETLIANALAAAAKADDPSELDDTQRRIVLEQVVLIKAERELKQCWEPIAKELFDLEQKLEPLEASVTETSRKAKEMKAETEQFKATTEAKQQQKKDYEEWLAKANAAVERIDPLELVAFTHRNVPEARSPTAIPRGLHGAALLKQMVVKPDNVAASAFPPLPGESPTIKPPLPERTPSDAAPSLALFATDAALATAAEDLAAAAAEDAACDDALDALNQLVVEDLIPLADYMRQTRKLARQQYMARALAIKIAHTCPDLLNLPRPSRPSPPTQGVSIPPRPSTNGAPGDDQNSGGSQQGAGIVPSSGVYPRAPPRK